MKACVSAHLPRHRLQGHTALDLLLLQILQGRKVAVGDGFVRQGPEMFRWLQLWRVRWKKQQMDSGGDLQLQARVPPSPIEYQQNLLVLACSHRTSKGL